MSDENPYANMHATTIITVRKDGQVVMAGDGQVSLGQTVMKGNARKVRRLAKGEVIPMLSRCSNGWNPSWSSIPASSSAPASNSPRTGGRTSICVGSRR